MTKKLSVKSLGLGISALILSGCATSKEHQLERVAKDWCLTIRASQVIPVYPLTEDVLPGDVFLTGRRVQDEEAEYKERGFLPLSQLIVRLHPQGIEDFYLSSHGTKGRTDPPYFWRFSDANAETNGARLMPRAAFPTYTFSTRHGAGLNIAIPVQGIPIAMNLVGSSEVDGTVLLTDAYTYGFDQANLQAQLREWATNNTLFLTTLAPSKGSTNYLRMVSRIFLVGGVTVAVNSAASYGGGVSGGAEKPVSLPGLGGTNTVESYTNALIALSSSLSTALNLPGGTLKVAGASSRSVSLNETFPRPLVIGYLAFDFPVLSNGDLGFPRATLHRLEGKPTALPTGTKLTAIAGPDRTITLLQKWLKADPENRKKLRDWLDQHDLKEAGITNVVRTAKYAAARQQIVDAFQIE